MQVDESWGKMVFLSPEKEKEWDKLDPKVKREMMHLLKTNAKRMETTIAIETLVQAINELDVRVKKLEETPCK